MNVARVPVADEVLGERICPCVGLRLDATLTLTELVTHLESFDVAKHKLPEYLEHYSHFSLSPVGKASKKALVAELDGKLLTLHDPALK